MSETTEKHRLFGARYSRGASAIIKAINEKFTPKTRQTKKTGKVGVPVDWLVHHASTILCPICWDAGRTASVLNVMVREVPCCERDHNKDGNCDRHPTRFNCPTCRSDFEVKSGKLEWQWSGT